MCPSNAGRWRRGELESMTSANSVKPRPMLDQPFDGTLVLQKGQLRSKGGQHVGKARAVRTWTRQLTISI